jgi:hypothetical protein
MRASGGGRRVGEKHRRFQETREQDEAPVRT